MKTSLSFPATALLCMLLSLIASARAARLTQTTMTVFPGEATPGHLSSTLFFGLYDYAGPATVDYALTITPGNLVVKTGTLQIHSVSASIFVELSFPYSALSPEETSTLVFTATRTNNIEIPGPFYYSIYPWTVARRLTVSGGSVAEGHAGLAGLPFTVAMDKALPGPLTFVFAGSGGTAALGGDYLASPGTATIPAGQTSVTVHLDIVGDTNPEEDETAGLALSGFTQLALVDTQTTGTIVTDDWLPGPAPSSTVVAEIPGNGAGIVKAWFPVDLPAPRVMPYSCRVSTRDGTALAGRDYNALSPVTLIFTSGETRKWVSITITASPEEESREQFFLDVEALDSHEVRSAACTIEPLTVSIVRAAPDIYRVRFPAGHGQRFVVEESTDMSPAGWLPNSGVFTGTGNMISHLMDGEAARKFYRVTLLTSPPPGTPAASS